MEAVRQGNAETIRHQVVRLYLAVRGRDALHELPRIGILWLGLTLAFELLFGRFVVEASWERLASDYNVLEGGLLPFGMIFLTLSPLLAGKVRGVIR
jgi:hypothetical protein